MIGTGKHPYSPGRIGRYGGFKKASMTYIADITQMSDLPLQANERGFGCFSCGQPLETSAVRYDGKGGSVLLHLRCANEMGQRLIVDSWTHRRKHVQAAS